MTDLTLSDEDTGLALALIFGFLLIFLGFKQREFMLLAGPCWILMGVAIFMPYGVAFMLMSVGVGLVLFIKGALDVF
jgi:hypothetical protein